jgi:predicted membrane protein
MILPPPDESSQRTIRRSRVVSYVLVALAAAVFSLRPDLFGDPQAQPWHALLHVWRIVAGLLLGVAALAVQVAVGVQWRRGLQRAAED